MYASPVLKTVTNSSFFRMEENLNKLERQEQDTLERWRIRSERAGLALDKLEGQISVIDDPIGNNLETVRRQEDAFEVQLGIGCYIHTRFLSYNQALDLSIANAKNTC